MKTRTSKTYFGPLAPYDIIAHKNKPTLRQSKKIAFRPDPSSELSHNAICVIEFKNPIIINNTRYPNKAILKLKDPSYKRHAYYNQYFTLNNMLYKTIYVDIDVFERHSLYIEAEIIKLWSE